MGTSWRYAPFWCSYGRAGCYTAHGIPTALRPLLFCRCQRTAMNAGLTPGWRAFLLRGLHDHWDDVELDRHRSQSLVDPTDVTAPPKHRQAWLTAASAERITGQQGWQLALLPAAIDQDARERPPFRHLFRLQVFRKPAMDMHEEQATNFNDECRVRVYKEGRLVCQVPYVPVKKSKKGDKLCATCVVPCADGTGGICGKQNTFGNVVNSHLRKTHKLTNEDAQRLLASLGLSAPMRCDVYHDHGSLQGQGAADEYAAGDAGWSGVSHPPMAAGQPIMFAGSVIYPSTDDESAPPPLGLLRVDDMDLAPSNSDLNEGIAPSYLQGHETLLGHEVGGLMQ
ncbi:unnamed protein product [Vitrella brassicaformis CCMP3155]|uniref:Uncharacterized protein n=1 Tax=Vitrella brassicaformis (strain CCMP3155) TaxID=1169540 RepID=A0A0G4EMB5_VITBC|nr:unnamed protein product [Vitrella brassicaformis CCMP3155]|eukprot:CEL98013.1 unnamed protein product [Vitrella brassicaformis CCMP3155]